jgi:tripeptide aminopeptidase
MKTEFDKELEGRLTRYAAISTQSDESSASSPSTEVQYDLLRLLQEELTSIGAAEVTLTEYGVVLATIPSTVDHNAPAIGLLAHIDTAPAFPATGVKPVVHRGYDGGMIRFIDAPELALSPENSPHLSTKSGHDIITASGTTLLGADDKAGVAIIMSAARHMLANPDIPHGPIRIAFTPDEEIGRGVNERLPGDLGADFAFTFDGSTVGDLECETFSADGAVVRVVGVSTHPGTAKDKMVNALHLGAKIIATLPHATLTPETTEGRDGFLHVYEMTGTAAEAEIKFIIRDFELEGLASKGALLENVCSAVQATEPRAEISCEIRPQYRNMLYWLKDDMMPIELARAACADMGIEVTSTPIRGGTDGSRLTEMGIPTPNIFTGMQEIHGPLEWISVQDMASATQVCLKLVQRAATSKS